MKYQVKLSPEGKLMCPVCDNLIREITPIHYANHPEKWDTNPLLVEVDKSSVAVFSDKGMLTHHTEYNPREMITLWLRCSQCHLNEGAFMYKIDIVIKQGEVVLDFDDNDWSKYHKEYQEREKQS